MTHTALAQAELRTMEEAYRQEGERVVKEKQILFESKLKEAKSALVHAQHEKFRMSEKMKALEHRLAVQEIPHLSGQLIDANPS